MNFSSILNKLTGKNKTQVQTSYNYKTFISEKQMYRYNQDIRNYRIALSAAESILNPNREQLYFTYANAITDAHLMSQMTTRKIKTLGKNFKVNRNGVEDKDATELLKTKWFQDFLDYAQDAVYYGYSLIHLKSIVDGVVSGVDLVPRTHVKPEQHLIVKLPSDIVGIDYESPELDPWTIGVGREKDLGILMQVTPLVLLKHAVTANWGDYSHIFGMPLRLGKTDLGDIERVKSMQMMLQEMSAAAYAVVDKDDEVSFTEAVKADGKIYENFLRWLDEQISKAIIGQTMTADNGSSRSQSEVHERVSNDYVDYDLRNLTYVVNDQLIPKLIEHGYDLKNCTFMFFDEEDKVGLFDMTVKLLQTGHEVDEKWITEKFGIPVTKAAPAPVIVPGEKQDEDEEEKGNFPKPAK